MPNAVGVERFRAAIAARLGLQFDDARLAFLEEVLGRRLKQTASTATTYLTHLETVATMEELGALAMELTTPETSFFRYGKQFRALVETVVPARLAARATERALRIASLGCASGEEAYSIAMLTHELVSEEGWTVSIVGVDANLAALDKARRATYSTWSLRETPPPVAEKWFRRSGRDFTLDHRIRAAVGFEHRNLADARSDVWSVGAYDVVFCRNVLMYFTFAQARLLIARVARALAPGGYLFLGHAETLRGLSSDFHLCHTHDTFYYQRKEVLESAGDEAPGQDVGDRSPLALVSVAAQTDSWVETIRRASARVAALTESGSRRGAARISTRAAGRWDLGEALALLREERFMDALAAVDRLPVDSRLDPDVLLLRAVLLTHAGELGQAEDACRRLLALDELHAGANYLLALCRECAGDRAGSLHFDQVAAYLDPGFAMPRLHQGLLARRAGLPAAAREHLTQALVLLEREDASRVLLFGGGFGRDALVALCRAELARCGGAA